MAYLRDFVFGVISQFLCVFFIIVSLFKMIFPCKYSKKDSMRAYAFQQDAEIY